MRIKAKTFLATLVALGISVGIAYAWSVPGVDEPFDPPDYYSPVNISYPDSAPSPFALRELSRGTVYDYTRHLKSILFGDKFSSINGSLISQLLNQIINMTGMDKNNIAQTQKNANDIFANTHALGLSNNVASANQQTLFRTTATVGNGNVSYDAHAQITWAENIYHTSLEAAANSDKDMEIRMQAVNTVLANSAAANGNVASLQTEAQMSALCNAEKTRRNTLLANYLSVEAAHGRLELDHDLEDLESSSRLVLPAYDPDQATARDKQNYTQPEAPGFYKF